MRLDGVEDDETGRSLYEMDEPKIAGFQYATIKRMALIAIALAGLCLLAVPLSHSGASRSAVAPVSPLSAWGEFKQRKLLLLRHALSEKAEHPEYKDHERPLVEQGESDAERAGRWLYTQRGAFPDLILCSNSTRTRQTLEAACKGYKAAFDEAAAKEAAKKAAEAKKHKPKDKDQQEDEDANNPYKQYYESKYGGSNAAHPDLCAAKTVFTDSLYGASEKHLLDSVHHTKDEVEALMVVAHDPAIGELANSLVMPTSAWSPGAMAMKHEFAPAGLAYLSFFCYDAGKLDWKGCVEPGRGVLIGYADPDALRTKPE